MYLTDLADAARKSGLKVVEISGWKTRGRPARTGGFNPEGILNHHTGDDADGAAYAKWLATVGRSDLPAPLAQLSLDRECVVYVLAAGRANHAGKCKAVGGWLSAGDGNEKLLGIEAQNTGSEGWAHRGKTASGEEITQYEALVRLNAALLDHYHWRRSHTLGHKETSVTGKWDPGHMDMTKFRADVAHSNQEEDMALTADEQKQLDAIQTNAYAIKTAMGKGGHITKKLERIEADSDATKAELAALKALVQAIATKVGADSGN